MEDYSKYKILVIGDSCKDVFVYGRSTRLSPEAPVPIFNIDNTSLTKISPGMAGNVTSNLESLGAKVSLITNGKSITKTRYVEDRTKSIMFRIDENDKAEACSSLTDLPTRNEYDGYQFDAVIISDYNKGFLNENDIQYICENNSNVFIDTKKLIGPWIKDASFIKINNEEYERTNHTLDHLHLEDKLIITLGGKGCQYKGKIYEAEKVPIKHLSGAGDTFLAGLVCEWLRTKDMDLAIDFAQKCATKVIQQDGVSVI